MPDDTHRIAELERANAALADSLKRCRALVSDYHAKLAANNNQADAPGRDRAEALRSPGQGS